MLAAIDTLIREVRSLCGATMVPADRWSTAANRVREALSDPQLQQHARSWPISPAALGLRGKHANLLFYEDPDYGFVLNGLIKRADARTTIHDHGRSHTVYGVVFGVEKVARYEVREPQGLDGAAEPHLLARAHVTPVGELDVGAGHVDYIAPWEVHAEFNGASTTAALILRSQRSGTFVQNIFHADAGTVEQYHGPQQIPYSLG
jgi:hypothetical protein